MIRNNQTPDFSSFWERLQGILHSGLKVQNWTAYGGYLGDSFTVTAIRPSYVEVSSPGAETIQHITRGEFEKVHEVWDGYVGRTIPRHKVRDLTRFSKYAISIIRRLK